MTRCLMVGVTRWWVNWVVLDHKRCKRKLQEDE